MLQCRFVVVVLVLGCGSDERGPPPRGVRGPAVAAPASTTEATPPVTGSSTPRRSTLTAASPMTPTNQPTASPESTSTMAPSRDRGPELVAAIGDPASCGDLGPVAARTLRLHASISASGRVTSAGVSGDLPAATRRCLEARIEAHVFAQPTERTETITAEVRLQGEETTTEERVPTSPTVMLQAGQQIIAGPTGEAISMQPSRAISNSPAQGIQAAPSQAIAGPSGTAISGPSGTQIGGSY